MSEELETVSAPESNLLASLESAIISLPEDVPTTAILQTREELLFYKQESTRLLKLVECRLIDRIKTNGPIEYGNGIRFYLSHDKSTKCNNLKATIDALGVATAGDENLFLGCFSSNAIKYGAAKKILPPEQYAELFTVTVKDKLEDGTPAPKKLVKADDKFKR